MSAKIDVDKTTIELPRTLKSRLDGLKPYQSMSYADLLEDMAGVYANERRAP